MKKSLVGVALMSVLSLSSLNAEILFNLHEQHFANAIEGGMKVGRYELEQSYVSTNLNFIQGYYQTDNDEGYFNVDLKAPIANWSVSVDLRIHFYYGTGKETRFIKLISENGETTIVSIQKDSVYFEGENRISESFDLDSALSFTLSYNNGKIDLSMNGKMLASVDRNNFGNLKSVEVGLVKEENNKDNLTSLTIGAK